MCNRGYPFPRKEKGRTGMQFGEKLQNARTAKRMSQAELAKAAGMTTRTIQYYETGDRLPRTRGIYAKLAEALEIEENILMDDNTDFILRASEKYGSRGKEQAWDMVADFSTMWAGGEMEEEDMDEIMHALQEAYWKAKKNNRKYVNKKYRDDEN